MNYLWNVRPTDVDIMFNGQHIYIPAGKAIRRVETPDGRILQYREVAERRMATGTEGQRGNILFHDEIPPDHMRQIAEITPGVMHIERNEDIPILWRQGIEQCISRLTNPTSGLITVYEERRLELKRDGQYLTPVEEDYIPGTLKPKLQAMREELKTLQRMLAQPAPTAEDLFDVEEEPELRVAVLKRHTDAQLAEKDAVIESVNGQLADALARISQLEAKMGSVQADEMANVKAPGTKNRTKVA